MIDQLELVLGVADEVVAQTELRRRGVDDPEHWTWPALQTAESARLLIRDALECQWWESRVALARLILQRLQELAAHPYASPPSHIDYVIAELARELD